MRWVRIALTLVLAALTLAAYWGVWRCGFVDYDDPEYVTQNPHVRGGLTGSGLAWAFGSAELGNWHPLTWLSHMLDCELFGLKPAGHHLTNLLLHLANTLLLFGVLVRLANLGDARQRGSGGLAETASQSGGVLHGDPLRNTLTGALAAGLFAVHPLHVESVAWIAERKDVLSTLFFLLTLWAYAGYVAGRSRVEGQGSGGAAKRPDRGARGWRLSYGLALVFFACGLMSKAMVVTLPCVLLLLDGWPLGRWSREGFGRLLREKVPFFALSVVFSGVTFVAQKEAGAVAPLWGFTLWQRVSNAVVSYIRYLRKTFWPDDLAVFYPHPGDWPLWQVAGATVLLAGVTWLTLRAARQRPWWLTGWLWYLGTLVPVIGLVQVGMQSIADRYTYIPLMGVFVALSRELAEALGRRAGARVVFGAVAAAALSACVMATRGQLQHWRDTEALFTQALRVTVNNDVAHNSLGGVRYQQGRVEEAIAHFREAVRLRPGYADAHNNLGTLLDAQGRTEEGIVHLQRAIELNPKYANAHNNLGLALLRLGRREEARFHLEQALRIQPAHAQALAGLAKLHAEAGRLEQARALYESAVRGSPEFWEARFELAGVLAGLGRTNDAIRELQSALTRAPDQVLLHHRLGSYLLGAGRVAEALAHFQRVVDLQPGFS
ncbi:MAG: tetratricopeptide repeat protein, partial [Verrucomicrobiales bacterium]|nr:tetratricopeptide repeat protein [Verrucomicrobiales bacterium]